MCYGYANDQLVHCMMMYYLFHRKLNFDNFASLQNLHHLIHDLAPLMVLYDLLEPRQFHAEGSKCVRVFL